MDRAATTVRHRWHHAVFAVCAAWLVLYELHVLIAPGLDAGVAHLAIRPRRGAGGGLAADHRQGAHRRAGAARVAADRRRRAGLVARRGLLHGRPLGRRGDLDPLARRRRLPAAARVRAGRHRDAAARPRPGGAADAVGRRRDRRARRGRPQRRAGARAGALQRRGPGPRGGHQPRLSAHRPRPARPHRRRAGRHRMASGPHVDAAGHRRLHLLARRLAVPRQDRRRELRLRRPDRHRLVDRAVPDRRGRLAAARRTGAAPRRPRACALSPSRSASG